MNRAAEVVKFYVLCNRLKNMVRTGWKVWNVQCERLESVAEHIYGTQMLAIAMVSEYQYEVNLERVVLMLAVHELEEIKIGDLTPFEISKSDKNRIGHEAVVEVLSGLLDGKKIAELVLEYDEGKTAEAKFAFFCDKLEAGLQCKLYDEMGVVSLEYQPNNKYMDNPEVGKYLQTEGSWSAAWLGLNKDQYNYDKNFAEVSDYVRDHHISIK